MHVTLRARINFHREHLYLSKQLGPNFAVDYRVADDLEKEDTCFLMAQLLIKYGANINQPFGIISSRIFDKNYGEVTPLAYAAEMGYKDLVKLFLFIDNNQMEATLITFRENRSGFLALNRGEIPTILKAPSVNKYLSKKTKNDF